jgi:hypothetical protein
MDYELHDKEVGRNLDKMHKKAQAKIKALEKAEVKPKEVFEGWKDNKAKKEAKAKAKKKAKK